MKSRSKIQRYSPHDGVFTRLAVSKLHGVGVFAIRRIKKGTYIFPDDKGRLQWLNLEQLKKLPKEVRRLYDDFCIIKDGGALYGCPRSFNNLTVSWYLNESKKPNVGCDKNYNFYALRDIKTGEELTADYSTYNEFASQQLLATSQTSTSNSQRG